MPSSAFLPDNTMLGMARSGRLFTCDNIPTGCHAFIVLCCGQQQTSLSRTIILTQTCGRFRYETAFIWRTGRAGRRNGVRISGVYVLQWYARMPIFDIGSPAFTYRSRHQRCLPAAYTIPLSGGKKRLNGPRWRRNIAKLCAGRGKSSDGIAAERLLYRGGGITDAPVRLVYKRQTGIQRRWFSPPRCGVCISADF